MQRRDIPIPLFTLATNMKPTGWHRISGSRFRFLFTPIVSRSFLLPSPVTCIRAFSRFRISCEEKSYESYDRYVLEMVKSIHIPSALAFFIYTGKAPLHKRAEIYGRKAASRVRFSSRSDESERHPTTLLRKRFPSSALILSKAIINYTRIGTFAISRNSKPSAKVRDLFCTLVERKSR